MAGDDAPRRAVARALAFSVYSPTFFFELGIGAIYPILALSADRMGASAALASAAVGAYALGRIFGSATGGVLAVRWGSPRAALAGIGATTAAALGCAASTHLAFYFAAAAAVGLGHAFLHVARQSHVIEIVPYRFRARGLTTLAGIWRIANFLGPLGGAFVIHHFGLRWAYVAAAVAMAVGGATLLASGSWRVPPHPVDVRKVTPARVLRENARVFSTLGVAVALTAAVRQARLAALPLWAAHLGLADSTTSAVFAVSAAVDMVLFLPAGLVMDQRGRKWTAIPSTLLVGVGLLTLPLTTGLATISVVAVALGLGNGWGSGLIMTLGSDVAPAEGRQVFMGLWMVFQDVGGLVGPAIVSLGAIASLAAGVVAAGTVGVGATGLLHRSIPPWRLKAGTGP